MKIKSTLVIEVDADDFISAGKHQAEIEKLITPVLAAYPQATVSFNQTKRRLPSANTATRPALRMASSTGNMNRYES